MKKVTQEAVYVCDICGREIDNSPYSLELVTLNFDVLRANGWNEWSEHREKHVHKQCICRAFGGCSKLEE